MFLFLLFLLLMVWRGAGHALVSPVEVPDQHAQLYSALRYQHGLSTPDLRQTLPNLKHFLEHGLLVRCDRHHVSSSIPVPVRSHLSVSQVAFPVSPEADKKKRRSQKLYDPVVTPLPVAMAMHEAPPDHLDVSVELEKPLEADRRAEDAGTSTPEPSTERYDPDAEKIPDRDPELPGEPRESECVEENLQHPGAMNGSAGVLAGAEVCCSVEQAEEIMGTEATGLGLGSRPDDFPCIPVEHAVAVECDDQVLGELENFQEFSKRIYALSENPSCFRRPRKNSDK
ncbi:hypothetical protein PDJAM_G00078990 [Pangasius djambal]|uniref:Uncharacterized protein n=1 Tax=Pangasius djambal TaxID=1691987 RepID=A0ACC5Z3F4_9TELE|nr:hypothetical protein [Pangasius djambal]